MLSARFGSWSSLAGRWFGERVAIEQDFAFSCDASGATAARRWLSLTLTEYLSSDIDPADLIYDALVVISELVTNAINAGCRNGRMSCDVEPRWVLLSVFDDAPGWPIVRHPGIGDGHGRGLRIVDALSTQRGTRVVPGGKQAWATLPRRT